MCIRDSLKGGLLTSVSLATSGCALATSSAALALPQSHTERAHVLRKMRFRADSGKVIWSFDGPAYSVVDGVLTPLYRLIHASIMEVEQRADGAMEVMQYEVGFRTDLNTGERLDTLKNPVTGEVVKVPYAPVGPTLLKFDAHNDIDLPEFIGGSRFSLDHKPDRVVLLGDTLMLHYHSQATIETEGKPTKVKNDMGLIHGPAKLALSAAVKNAPAFIHSTDTGAYSGWLNMPEEISGVQTLRAVGQKVDSVDKLPPAWRKLAQETDPEIVKNPQSVFVRKQMQFKN